MIESVLQEEKQRAPAKSSPPTKGLPVLLRLALLLLILAGVYLIGYWTGAANHCNTITIRKTMVSAGVFGLLAYFAFYMAGNLLHVPGMVFVSTGIIAYGSGIGAVVALAGSLVAISFSFLFVRFVGGTPLAEIKKPLVKKMLSKLNDRPVITIALLRIVLISSPPLNYFLALSKVRFRDYFLGSVLGLLIPISAVAIFFHFFVG